MILPGISPLSKVMAGLCAVLVLSLWVMKDRWDATEEKLDDAIAMNKLLESEIDTQNTMIEQWKASAELRAKAAEQAMKLAASERSKANSIARGIEVVALPDDECEAYRMLIREARKPPSWSFK